MPPAPDAFVLDTSVTMAWCFEDEVTPYTEAVLDRLETTTALVPPVWQLEVANVLLVGERRKRLTQAQTARFTQLLRALPIVSEGREGLAALLAVGREHNLSAYDASYLALALASGLPLATSDAKLRAAAERAGVPLVTQTGDIE